MVYTGNIEILTTIPYFGFIFTDFFLKIQYEYDVFLSTNLK